MKLPQGANRIGRVIGLLMFALGSFLVILLIAASIQTGVAMEGIPILLALVLLWAGFVWISLSEFPCIELTEEGIAVRILLRKRFYAWGEIKQAGILYRHGRGCMYNELVLVTPGGSARKYKDKWFLLRNPFTVIKMAYDSEEVREYVRKHYGPLDFDLSDGQTEQSTVVDS